MTRRGPSEAAMHARAVQAARRRRAAGLAVVATTAREASDAVRTAIAGILEVAPDAFDVAS